MMNTDKIIQTLKKIRKEKGFTQVEVAKHLNISFQQYNYYETRKSEMTLTTFLKILEFLEIKVQEFFELEKGKITLEEMEEMEKIVLRLKDKLM